MLLRNISAYFASIGDVYHLADILLEGIEPQSGTAWVKGKAAPGGVLNPQQSAQEVLEHWCDVSRDPPPYGSKLYEALNQVLPRAARKFKSDLL